MTIIAPPPPESPNPVDVATRQHPVEIAHGSGRRDAKRWYHRRAVATDLFVVVVAIALAQAATAWAMADRYHDSTIGLGSSALLGLALAGTWAISLAAFHTRDVALVDAGSEEYRRVVLATVAVFGLGTMLVTTGATFGITLYSNIHESFPVQVWSLISLLAGSAGLPLGRYLLRRILGRRRARGELQNQLSQLALERVNLVEAADRKVAGYSKGMRQRIRLAQSIAHQPAVLILDEPLNGLDPMVRAETIALFRKLASEGLHLIISSHILHEVDMMSDRVVLLNNGYIVAEGNIHGVRDEMEEHPMQILIRCEDPSKLAAYVFAQDHVVEARLHEDRRGLFIKTRDADRFYLMLNRAVAEGKVSVESIAPVDDDLSAVYQYLIGTSGGSA